MKKLITFVLVVTGALFISSTTYAYWGETKILVNQNNTSSSLKIGMFKFVPELPSGMWEWDSLQENKGSEIKDTVKSQDIIYKDGSFYLVREGGVDPNNFKLDLDHQSGPYSNPYRPIQDAYHPNIAYGKYDLVVYNNKIYYAMNEGVNGVMPGNGDNWVYVGTTTELSWKPSIKYGKFKDPSWEERRIMNQWIVYHNGHIYISNNTNNLNKEPGKSMGWSLRNNLEFDAMSIYSNEFVNGRITTVNVLYTDSNGKQGLYRLMAPTNYDSKTGKTILPGTNDSVWKRMI